MSKVTRIELPAKDQESRFSGPQRTRYPASSVRELSECADLPKIVYTGVSFGMTETGRIAQSLNPGQQVSNYLVSTSRAKVWRRPEDHPLLKHTDTAHPALRGKLEDDTFPPRVAEGLPKILSENSEDARTWYYFSPCSTTSRSGPGFSRFCCASRLPMRCLPRRSRRSRAPGWSSGQNCPRLRAAFIGKESRSRTC